MDFFLVDPFFFSFNYNLHAHMLFLLFSRKIYYHYHRITFDII